MIRHRIAQWCGHGIGHFLWTFRFFFGHPALVLLSLIPSMLRMIQLWNGMRTPFWMEMAVEFTRVVLFVLIIPLMAKTKINQVVRAQFWRELMKHCSAHWNQTWPHVIVPQMIAFVLLMYGLMNLLISLLVNEWTVQTVMALLNIREYDSDAASDSILFFIKNMSIIPMALVYWIGLFGVRDFAKSQ